MQKFTVTQKSLPLGTQSKRSDPDAKINTFHTTICTALLVVQLLSCQGMRLLTAASNALTPRDAPDPSKFLDNLHLIYRRGLTKMEFDLEYLKHSVILTPMLAMKPRDSPKLPSLSELNLPKAEISPPNSPSVNRLQHQESNSPNLRRHSVSSPVSIRELPNTPSFPEDETMLLEAFSSDFFLTQSPNSLRRASLDSALLAPAPNSQWQKNSNTIVDFLDQKASEDMFKRKMNEETSEMKPKKSRAPKKSKKVKFNCEGDSCKLCINGTPYYLQRTMSPGWRETIMAVFEYFPKRVTESSWKKYQNQLAVGLPAEDPSDKNPNTQETKWLFFPDAYDFLEYHWEQLCPPQHKSRPMNSTNWKKTLQDTLSHNRTFFISGKEMFGKTGFWRMSEHAIVGNVIPFDPRQQQAPVNYQQPPYISPFQTQYKEMVSPNLQRVNYTSPMLDSPNNLRV